MIDGQVSGQVPGGRGDVGTGRPPRVSVVIPSWNGAAMLPRVLDSLRAQQFRDFETVVVDNGSEDGSVRLLADDYPEVRVVALPRNAGFAAAVNAGVAASRSELVALLNNDAVARPGWLGALVAAADMHPEAGSFASRMLDLRDPSRIDAAGDQLGIFASNCGHGAPDGEAFDAPAYVLSACAGAAAYRRTALADVGPFDERYFAYMEDMDWGVRAQLRGHDCLYVPNAVVLHEGSKTSDRIPDRKFFLLMRNSLLVFFQYMPPLRRLAWAPVMLVRVMTNGVTRGAGIKSGWRAIAAAFGDWPRIHARRREARRTALVPWRELRRRLAPPLAHADFSSLVFARGDGARRPVVPARPAVNGLTAVSSTGEAAVDVIIVNWNGGRYLPRALRALARSTVPVRILLVDNASTDDSLSVAAGCPDVDVLALDRNLGYAGGANAGLARTTSPFAFIMNADVLVESDHLEVLRDRLLQDTSIGAAQGKLYRIGSETFLGGDPPERRLLDSAGLAMRRSRFAVDRGQGEPDGPAFDVERSVFGATGAALFLRRSMLQDLGSVEKAFDPVFFAYKEDIDLAWRARLHGWDIRYVPRAVAHHVRAMPGVDPAAWRRLPVDARRHSWKNHYLMMMKNDRPGDLLRSLPHVAAWEAGRLAFALTRDPALLRVYLRLARLAPAALRERRRSLRRARRRGIRLHAWFGRDSMPPLPRLDPASAQAPGSPG
ncbi:MAG: glycosyltransferase family 2 protein [Gemmatimonadota bacterium]